jgi:hypothetical protein
MSVLAREAASAHRQRHMHRSRCVTGAEGGATGERVESAAPGAGIGNGVKRSRARQDLRKFLKSGDLWTPGSFRDPGAPDTGRSCDLPEIRPGAPGSQEGFRELVRRHVRPFSTVPETEGSGSGIDKALRLGSLR